MAAPTMSTAARDAALVYANIGWHVFPAPPDSKKSYKSAKHSDGRRWGATIDPAEIRADFSRWPRARVAIVTGVISGIVVIETDAVAGHGVDGAAALDALEFKHGPLPETLKAMLPSGSIHRYFLHPGNGIKIRNSASELGAGVDVRADGGMVIAPPSINADGRRYAWLACAPIAPMPEWLIGLTREQPRSISQRAVDAIRRPQYASSNGSSGSSYGEVALEKEIAELCCAPPGERNAALYKAARPLFALCAGGELREAEVVRRLLEATQINGARDSHNEIMRTIESARRAGFARPRSRGPR
jgi:hypothetical protein